MLTTLVGLLGVAAAAWVLVDRELDALLTPSAELAPAQTNLARPLPGEPANILVLGSDYRSQDYEDGERSDTLMLVRLDPVGDSISMLSFPRDLWVPIPGVGERKINEAYSEGGAKLAVETVQQLTDLDIHFITTVDMGGFRGVVDALGGVYVDIDRRYFNDNSSGQNYAEIDLQPGYQRLTGGRALDFARYRHTDSDFHRIARQQLVLTELKRQVSRSDLARNARALYNVAAENTDIAAGGTSRVSIRTIVDYIRLGIALEASDIYRFQVTGEVGTHAPSGASIVVASPAEIAGAVDAFLDPDDSARDAAAAQVAGEQAAAGEDSAAAAGEDADGSDVDGVRAEALTVPIVVYNGNGIANSADEVAEQLRGAGYTAVEVGGNADRFDYARTVVYFATLPDEPFAEIVAGEFDGADVEASRQGLVAVDRISVVVGSEGRIESAAGVGLGLSVPQSERLRPANQVVPEEDEPGVVEDAEYARAEYEAGRRRARMRMYAPTVREASSTLQGEVRTYLMQGRQPAYRITMRTAEGHYWGLQGTAWTDPPILDNPTRTVERGGRTLQVYMDGTKVRMVAWREPDGVYWVSNSLLAELDNQTMLAIAAGARAIPRVAPS